MARKRRHPPISYRPPVKLRAEFHARVLDSGMSANAFITRAVFGQAAPRARRQAALDQQAVAQLLAKAARISDSLAALTADGAASGAVGGADESALEACRAELTAIRTLLMETMGRAR